MLLEDENRCKNKNGRKYTFVLHILTPDSVCKGLTVFYNRCYLKIYGLVKGLFFFCDLRRCHERLRVMTIDVISIERIS